MKLVTVSQMQSIEQACVDRGIALVRLMENAGRALAEKVAQLVGDGAVTFLIGPGNNGGDGLVAAEVLAKRNTDVRVYTFKRASTSPFNGRVVRAEDDEDGSNLREFLLASSVVVDGLLGIGQNRPVEGPLAHIVRIANTRPNPGTFTLAVDIPTGVDADTGEVLGEAFQADGTLCMGFAKVGTVVYPGATYAGALYVTGAGIPNDLADPVTCSLTDSAEAKHLLPERAIDANKGSSGRLLAVCGSRDFTGAPVLVSLAAYRCGAGLVELAIPERIKTSVASHALEPIYLPLPDVNGKLGPSSLGPIRESLEKARAFVLGSGMGLSDATVELVGLLLDTLRDSSGTPAVFDADGLNALAQIPHWHRRLKNIVLTPHPGEMSRLTGLSIAEVQRDRTGIARNYAAEWGITLVLKGARTVVASPDGKVAINFSGGPNLATAGTGDILTGVIGGLLAQGSTPWDAARCGAYLHGSAADLWSAQHGDVGMLASDLLKLLPIARRSILRDSEEI